MQLRQTLGGHTWDDGGIQARGGESAQGVCRAGGEDYGGRKSLC